MFIVWAMGRLDMKNNEPAFHDVFPKKDVIIHFNPNDTVNDCFSFTRSIKNPIEAWDPIKITDRFIHCVKFLLK